MNNSIYCMCSLFSFNKTQNKTEVEVDRLMVEKGQKPYIFS